MSFYDECYKLLATIPIGKVTTYKEISHALNSKAYRAVGTAMNKNKNPIIIPCHRVVNSNGSVGQYAFGVEKKISLLENEGVKIKNGKIVEFEKHLYLFGN